MQLSAKNSLFKSLALLPALFVIATSSFAPQTKSTLSFTVSMNPQTHYFHVVMNCSGFSKDTLNFKMPVWMPGYYQLMNYAKNVENFTVTNSLGKEIK